MRRLLRHLNVRQPEEAPREESPAVPISVLRRWRLTHLMVVMANALQLLCMITFVALLLAQLNGSLSSSWYAIFAPLWASDAITLATGIHELVRIAHSDGPRRNACINQVNRLKGCLCVALFKVLLVQRLDGVYPDLPIRVVCSPYYVAAVLRCMLHYCKTPILPAPPDASRCQKLQRARPGTPINPVHLMVVVLACRLDGLFDLSWAVTFIPMWLLFGFLAIVSVGVGCLAIGILLMREPHELGQRTLFFICFCILLTITSTGTNFLINLCRLLDGDTSISYASVLLPLIVGYSVLLACYLTFTLVLPRLLLHDINAAALGEEEEAEEEEGGLL